MNYGELKRVWREAFRNRDITQRIETISIVEKATTKMIALPNLNSSIGAIHLRLKLDFSASAAASPVNGAQVIDIIDDLNILDKNGKAVINTASGKGLYLYCADFLDEAPRQDSLPSFAAAGTGTATADIIIPTNLPVEEEHKLQIEFAPITSLYASNVSLAATSKLDISIIICDDLQQTPKWKTIEQKFDLVAGEKILDTIPSGRTFFALAFCNINKNTDIDDLIIRSQGIDLIAANFQDLNNEFLQTVDYATRNEGDTIVQFRSHIRQAGDFILIEGTTNATITLLSIHEADTQVPTEPTKAITRLIPQPAGIIAVKPITPITPITPKPAQIRPLQQRVKIY